MTALKTPEKTSRRQELRRNWLVELYGRLLLFYEDNRTVVYGIGVGLVALALAVPGYVYYQNQQAQQANQMLGQILPVYEQGNYQQALNGTGDRLGLTQIADQYGGTSAGNLASFYAATAFYRQQQYDQALQYYQQFDKSNDFIGAAALAAEASIYESRGEYDQAAAHYEEAAAQYENERTVPRYLLEAGRAYEDAGNYGAAVETYRRIVDEYPDAEQAALAKRYLGRAQARQSAAND